MSQDSRKRWATVKELLHTADKDNTRTEEENRTACMAIADFFADKIREMQHALNSKLAGTVFDPFAFYVLCGPQTDVIIKRHTS